MLELIYSSFFFDLFNQPLALDFIFIIYPFIFLRKILISQCSGFLTFFYSLLRFPCPKTSPVCRCASFFCRLLRFSAGTLIFCQRLRLSAGTFSVSSPTMNKAFSTYDKAFSNKKAALTNGNTPFIRVACLVSLR